MFLLYGAGTIQWFLYSVMWPCLAFKPTCVTPKLVSLAVVSVVHASATEGKYKNTEGHLNVCQSTERLLSWELLQISWCAGRKNHICFRWLLLDNGYLCDCLTGSCLAQKRQLARVTSDLIGVIGTELSKVALVRYHCWFFHFSGDLRIFLHFRRIKFE